LAQPTTVTKSEYTDVKAKALLDKVKKLYESYTSLESSFRAEYKMAEQEKGETLSGKIYQQGDNFRVDMGSDFVISDGKVIWQKTGNTVQIKNANSKDADDLMSPKALMRLYEKKEFIFGITGEGSDANKKVTLITGKPNNRRSEYTKIILAIDQKSNQVVSVTAFGRDQSRYKVSLETPTVNQKYDSSKFVFDKAKYPKVKVEDLRVD
jgi:outer membrane lipoprotein-sorting protein